MVETSFIQKEHTKYKSFVEKLKMTPLWVKQAIYSELRQDISSESDINFIDKHQDKILQLYVPEISCDGKRLLMDSLGFNSKHINIRKFLNDASDGHNMIEICQNNSWSLKEGAIILLELMNDNLVEPFVDSACHSLVLFLTGKIRIGEFLYRLNKISYEQLDKAICAQKYASDFEGDMRFTEVLINLGYANKTEIEKIYNIRESAEKKVSLVGEIFEKSDELNVLQDDLDSVIYEKIKLEKLVDDLRRTNKDLKKQIEEHKRGFFEKIFASK